MPGCGPENRPKTHREGEQAVMRKKDVKVVKKDGTKEVFNVQKVVVAVNKSAYRALIKLPMKN